MADFTVSLRIAEEGEIQAERKEALRYMGYGHSQPDAAVSALIDACEKELIASISGRACYALVPVSFPQRFTVDLGFGIIESVSLSKHLQGCHSAFLFAATIGIGPDRLIGKYSRLSPSKAAITDALASSAIESWCDTVELEITRNMGPHCARFSPGYGDFPLEAQEKLTSCLNTAKLLGIALSSSLLMTPTKSVTAVIGIGASARTCGNKCMFCNKKNCIYREVLV